MITIKKINNKEPYKIFYQLLENANNANQKTPEAISISSFNPIINEVESRYVNLKYIDNDKWVFFTNYNSPKSQSFQLHNQISVIIFWESINLLKLETFLILSTL